MIDKNIVYKINQARYEDIFKHLNSCSHLFEPPLYERVNINDYVRKIYEKSDTFEAWGGDELIGLIAVYCNNLLEGQAFITNVSVGEKYNNMGIASKLLKKCIKYIKGQEFKGIVLNVNSKNEKAICLYKKHNFQYIRLENEFVVMRYKV